MFRGPKAAPTGHAADAVTDIDAYAWTGSNGDWYRDLFISSPLIAEAMGYSDLDASTKTAIWDAIDAAETLGFVASVPAPAATPPDPDNTIPPFVVAVEPTQPEFDASYGAKVAHCLKLEKDATYPWRVASYDVEWLRDLLDFNRLWDTRNPRGEPTGAVVDPYWELVIDQSPFDAHALAVSYMDGATTHSAAIANIIENGVRAINLVHYVGGDPADAILMTYVPTQYPRSGGVAISRSGCHSAARWVAALCRSINIPAYASEGWDGGHASCTLFSIGRLIGHGDDLYGSGPFGSLPVNTMLREKSVWDATVFPLGRYSSSPPIYEIGRDYFDRVRLDVSAHYRARYLSFGWGSLEPLMLPYYVGEEQLVDDYHNLLRAVTGSEGFTPAPAVIVPDDFSSGSLGAHWTAIDPVGDCSLSFDPLPNARAVLTLPAGVHEPGLQDTTYQLVQDFDNQDFEVEAKFETQPAADVQYQGIVVRGSPQMLFADARYYFAGYKMYLTNPINGQSVFQAISPAATIWIRLARAGTQYTAYYSTNGVDFAQYGTFAAAIDVQSVGIFAGNSGGTPPAWEAKCDYFWDTSNPITPEDP